MKVHTVNTVNCYAQSCPPPRLGIYLLQEQVLQDWAMNQRQEVDECWKMEDEPKSEVQIEESRYLLASNRMSKNEALASLKGEPFSGRESRRSLIIFIVDRVQGIGVS